MGTELLIGIALAFVVLGPERMHSMLGHLSNAHAQLEKASRETRELIAKQVGAKDRHMTLRYGTQVPNPGTSSPPLHRQGSGHSRARVARAAAIAGG